MTIRDDFVKFVKQNNLVSLAIAFVIGGAVTALITALVTDLITPAVGVFLHVNFSSWSFTVNGSTFLQGAFVNAVVSFIIILLVVFFLIALPYQRWQNALAAKAVATQKACPECTTQIPIAAKRCPACTAVLTGTAAAPASA